MSHFQSTLDFPSFTKKEFYNTTPNTINYYDNNNFLVFTSYVGLMQITLEEQKGLSGTFEIDGCIVPITSQPTYGPLVGLDVLKEKTTDSREEDIILFGNILTCPELCKVWKGPVMCADGGKCAIRNKDGQIVGTKRLLIYKNKKQSDVKNVLKTVASRLVTDPALKVKHLINGMPRAVNVYKDDKLVLTAPSDTSLTVDEIEEEEIKFKCNERTGRMCEPPVYGEVKGLEELREKLEHPEEETAILCNIVTAPLVAKVWKGIVLGPNSSTAVKDESGNMIGVRELILYEKQEEDKMDVEEEEKEEKDE